MRQELKKIKEEILAQLKKVENIDELDNLEVKFLGRRGQLTLLLKGIANLSPEEKKVIGRLANAAKEEIEKALQEKKLFIKAKKFKNIAQEEWIDLTMPGEKFSLGHLHPLSQMQNRLVDIFLSLGFMVLDGPELDSDYYNFEALNIPKWHPARDTQDTFYVEEFETKSAKGEKKGETDLLLRTQTSAVQVRALEKYGAPLRVIIPGRVFRREATDASHDNTFYQIEGLMIDKNINLTHLKGVIRECLNQVFDKKIKLRFRPGYFPFTEPSLEMDLDCLVCGGKGCRVCKHSGWLEFMGAGLVHPNVLRYGGIDSEVYQGFAFGFGLTRLVMLKYRLDDIRLLHGGDLRFLKQF
ncbi:MAG: phenylalanine--tRNA ligase subunit alpha [bacterium]